jgi:hypothetical protein
LYYKYRKWKEWLVRIMATGGSTTEQEERRDLKQQASSAERSQEDKEDLASAWLSSWI